jgi:hypothetical protein
MPIAKLKWSRRLAVALCIMLLLCTALPVTAFADDVHIATAYQPFMYFECNEPGYWIDLGTPPHSVVETGQAAYCLQMSKESPYGDEYTATDGSQYYKPKIMNGLKAILEYGYPASTGGFNANQAQYATANAIRFFLAENGIKEMPAFLKNTKNCRPKPGYEALFDWCLELLEHGRHPDTDRSITFSSPDLMLEFRENAFEGDTTVTLTNLNGGYTLDTSAFPAGTSITGYTGKSGDTLHFSIPEEYEESAFTLSASGTNSSNQAVLFFYAPTTSGQQRVVTCQYELTTDSAAASMTVRTPEGPNYGFLSIRKEDRETGTALPGVCFRVCDAAGAVVAEGCTDENGVFTTGKLDLGDYTFQEISTVQGYRLNEMVFPISLVNRKETVTITATNDSIKGTIRVFKRDAAGAALANVTFVLEASEDGGASWESINAQQTGADGAMAFTDLPANDGTIYRITETATVPGKMLAGMTIYQGPLPMVFSADQATDGKEYEIYGDTAYLYELSFTVCDSSITELPFTGGDGFLSNFVASTLLVCLGAFFMLKSKKTGMIQ